MGVHLLGKRNQGHWTKSLLAIAGIIMLVGFFIPWAEGGNASFFSYESIGGRLLFFSVWLMIIGAMVSYNLFRSYTLQELRPFSDSTLGILGGIIGLVGIYIFITEVPPSFSLSWGLYISVAGCLVGLISAIVLFFVEIDLSLRKPRRRSGGL